MIKFKTVPTSYYLFNHSFINDSTAICWTPGLFFSFVIFFTQTPWMSDQPVDKPLPTHRATQTQNKRAQTHPCLEWIRTHDPREDSSCLEPRGHRDRQHHIILQIILKCPNIILVFYQKWYFHKSITAFRLILEIVPVILCIIHFNIEETMYFAPRAYLWVLHDSQNKQRAFPYKELPGWSL
jgi:hypothetical protein